MTIKTGILLVLVAIAHGQNLTVWSGDDVPNPQANPSACGLSEPGQVCDTDQLLGDEASRQQVLSTLARLSNESNMAAAPRGLNGMTHCQSSDAKVDYWAVIVNSIKNINPKSDKPTDPDMIAFASKVSAYSFKAMSESDCQNYVLISVAKEPRLVYLMKGKHVPDDLGINPDAYFDSETEANLKAGELNQAVMRIAENLNGNLQKLPAKATNRSSSVEVAGQVASFDYEGHSGFSWAWLILIVIVASVLLLLLLLCIYVCWAAYYRRKKTGKWRLIPIRVRHLSKTAPDDVVYPESIASQTVTRTHYTNDDTTQYYSTLGGYRKGNMPVYSSPAHSPVSDEGQQVTPRDLDASSLESTNAYATPHLSAPDQMPKEARITSRP